MLGEELPVRGSLELDLREPAAPRSLSTSAAFHIPLRLFSEIAADLS